VCTSHSVWVPGAPYRDESCRVFCVFVRLSRCSELYSLPPLDLVCYEHSYVNLALGSWKEASSSPSSMRTTALGSTGISDSSFCVGWCGVALGVAAPPEPRIMKLPVLAPSWSYCLRLSLPLWSESRLKAFGFWVSCLLTTGILFQLQSVAYRRDLYRQRYSCHLIAIFICYCQQCPNMPMNLQERGTLLCEASGCLSTTHFGIGNAKS
jgi:hypothetical protein